MTTARFGNQTTPRHDLPMDAREISDELQRERSWHRLHYRKGQSIALCSCGKSFVDVTERTVHGRHAMHVEECLTILKDRLEGR
jgi:hypothetical protein